MNQHKNIRTFQPDTSTYLSHRSDAWLISIECYSWLRLAKNRCTILPTLVIPMQLLLLFLKMLAAVWCAVFFLLDSPFRIRFSIFTQSIQLLSNCIAHELAHDIAWKKNDTTNEPRYQLCWEIRMMLTQSVRFGPLADGLSMYYIQCCYCCCNHGTSLPPVNWWYSFVFVYRLYFTLCVRLLLIFCSHYKIFSIAFRITSSLLIFSSWMFLGAKRE